jgi:hypothetical protein
MILLIKKALRHCGLMSVLLATTGLTIAHADATTKSTPAKFEFFRQPDGSGVERLAASTHRPGATTPSGKGAAGVIAAISSGVQEATTAPLQVLATWLESRVEPQAMTALASVPVSSREAGQTLPEVVNPALARNWAEVVDPTLALLQRVLVIRNGFSEALLQHPETASGSRGLPLANGTPSTGMGSTTPWRNGAGGGTKPARSGQQALHDWQMMPMPAPRATPWLSNLDGYRY